MRTIMLAALVAWASGGDPPTLQPAAPWNLDYGDSRCSLTRTYGDTAAPVTLMFEPGFFGGTVTTLVTGTRKQLGRQGSTNVTLTVPGREASIQAAGTRFHLPTGDSAVLRYVLESNELESLVDAPAIAIDTQNGPSVVIALSLGKSAIASLRRCEADLLRKFGYDATKVARVAKPPRSNPGAFMTDRDYPEAARKADVQGPTFVGMTIGINGRLSDCRILRSSGVPSLDQATCLILSERGRFQPGLDADGQPIESYQALNFDWRLPR